MATIANDLLAAFAATQVTRRTESGKRAVTTLADLLNSAAPADAAVILSAQSQNGATTTKATAKKDMRTMITAEVAGELRKIAAAAIHLADNLGPDDVRVSATTGKDGGRTGSVRAKVTVTERESGVSFAQVSVGVTVGTAYGFALSRYAAPDKDPSDK